MKYMLLIYDNENANLPESERSSMEEWFAYTKSMREAGAYVGGDALQPTPTASSVRMRGGERVVTDGPFAETTEHLGGYYMVDVETKAEAIEWAARCPGARHGTIEVRELMVFPDP